MISNCTSDENGKLSGGVAGDQTGREWVMQPWYSRPWNVVLRFNDATVRETIAQMAEAAANNNNIGYDQKERYGFWQQLSKVGYHPEKINTPCEVDCSAGVAAIVKGAGYRLNNDKLRGVSIYSWTGDLRAQLIAAGATALTNSKYLTSDKYLLRGDVLLYEGHHTAINCTDGSATIPTTTKTTGLSTVPKWVGKATTMLNVRSGAGVENKQLAAWPFLGPGNLADVCDTTKAKDGGTWYYIRIAGKYYGYVNASYIKKV